MQAYERVHERVHEWFLIAQSKCLPVMGPLLKEDALEKAAELGMFTFTAGIGWLFLNSREDVSHLLSGESDSATFSEKLQHLIIGRHLHPRCFKGKYE